MLWKQFRQRSGKTEKKQIYRSFTDTGRKAGDPSEDSFRQHFPKGSGYPETGNTAGRVKEPD